MAQGVALLDLLQSLLQGLGVEVAKNVVLGGVKSVSLYDNQPVQMADLGAQFFLTLRLWLINFPSLEPTVTR